MSSQPSTSNCLTSRKRKPSEKKAQLIAEQEETEQPQKKTTKTKKKRQRKDRIDSNSSCSSSSDNDLPTHKRQKPLVAEEIDVDEANTDEPREEVQQEDTSDDEIQIVGDRETKNDGLKDRHNITLPSVAVTKAEMTRDLLLIFSDIKTVVFKEQNERKEVKGRWCLICRKSAGADRKKVQKAFLQGSNSTCRQHIRQHYEIYSQKCKEHGIPESEYCIPRNILKARKAESDGKKPLVQGKLDRILQANAGVPKEFSREAVLKAVTIHIACNDESFDLANKAAFRNCLVTMRPHTLTADLPSAYDIKKYLEKEFVRHLETLAKDINNSPGMVSITSDGWTADTTSLGFVGLTMHWISVNLEGRWRLKMEVIGMRGLSGNHSGKNLGRYIVGLLDRVGIINHERSKLNGATLDNTASNTYICKEIARVHKRRGLEMWNHQEKQFMCLGHIINLANIDIMKHITHLAALENKTAIWEFDPALAKNRIANGGLDVIATLRTLAIKIQASGARIEYFNELQLQTGITTPLKIPLHSNVRWGTAHGMLDRAYKLRQAIGLFIAAADTRFGPITTIRKDGGGGLKKIPWTAFTLSELDWQRVADARDILEDSNKIQQCFSSENQASLWRALPLIEELKTKWEKRRDGKAGYERFTVYGTAIQDGLDKLKKYYQKFDKKPAYVLALILHPYYKLDYIELAWGGQDADNATKDWREEAIKILETTAEYYWTKYFKKSRQHSASSTAPLVTSERPNEESILTEFDRRRQARMNEKSKSEGESWASEVRRYLKALEENVSKDMDLVEWWQDQKKEYPVLRRISLDVLAIQASSVPCERLFSSSKQVATDRRARLGSDRFEQLLVMKSAWRGQIVDWAAANADMVETVDMIEYGELLQADQDASGWDQEDDNMMFKSDIDSDDFKDSDIE